MSGKNEDTPWWDHKRYSVLSLQRQVHFDILISFGIFIATQVGSAIVAPYWRPVAYAIGWAILSFIVGIIGIFGVKKKSSFLIIVFSVLLIMLACLNISHTLTMRSEHVHTCRLNQRTFRNCESEPSLKDCLADNQCKRDEILKTECEAPGREHCDDLDHMNYLFAANMCISFLTFSEPTFWAILLLIRMEMTFPITPDEWDADDSTEQGTPEEKAALTSVVEDKSLEGSGKGAGTGAFAGYDSVSDDNKGSLRWL